MKEITIAFDVDGTIYGSTLSHNREGTPNLEVFNLMRILHGMKNTRIIVWSGGGKDYAEQIVRKFGIGKWVHSCYGKHEYDTTIYSKVDIAFDDQHEFVMADKNIIVRMK